ncbi:MAG: glycosyltransferase family 4 protein [Lacibacter sp.]
MSIPKLAIITTHPIQYNAPLFRLLSERRKIAVKVFYTWGQSKEKVYDARFGIERNWDVPLLDGYEYEFINSTVSNPDSNRFFGIINKGLYQRLLNEQFDGVLVFRWSVWSHLLLLQKLGKQPLLFFRGDSHLLQQPAGWKRSWKRMLLQFVYRNVDVAFATGTHSRNYFLFSGIKPGKVTVAPHAVDNLFFSKDAVTRETAALQQRRQLGIPDEAVVFLYAGKFYHIKHLHLLIRAFMQMQTTQHRLLLVGNGEQEAELKSLAAGHPHILFQPFQNQSAMPVLYRTGDVFVLPSKSETWGLSVNEAMACERPVIVSDQCGCASDLVLPGQTGFIFESGNTEQLQQQLLKFPNRAVAQKMGQTSAAFIQQFSLERIADAIEQTLLKQTTASV